MINNQGQTHQNNQKHQTIKNKGFLLMHEDFIKAGWYLAENDFNHIVYEKEGFKCNQFTIDIFENHIKVNVPIGNTNYSYSTKFAEYFRAQEFILMHLNAIEDAIKEKYNNKRFHDDDVPYIEDEISDTNNTNVEDDM